MPQFIFVYLGGEFPSDPEEGQKHLQRYQQWLDSLGQSVVSPAIPFKDTHVVQPDGTAEPMLYFGGGRARQTIEAIGVDTQFQIERVPPAVKDPPCGV